MAPADEGVDDNPVEIQSGPRQGDGHDRDHQVELAEALRTQVTGEGADDDRRDDRARGTTADQPEGVRV